MIAESYWILTGDNRVSTISYYSKQIKEFSDDGLHFAGAYGPKVVAQFPFILDAFREDPQTRQAVINIWRESPRSSRDIPCTLSLQFVYRSNRLHCIATMRSSDIWLGWVYDVFNFSMISAYVLECLKKINPMLFGSAKLGNLYLTAGSQHLYEDDFEKAKQATINIENWKAPREVETELGIVTCLGIAKDWKPSMGFMDNFLTDLLGEAYATKY